jgi:hypothetical protein
MPRVHHVKKARKANKAHGIKKGDSYYWWKFRFGGKCVSKTPPRQSQLTRSEFWGRIYELQERERPSFDDLESTRDEIQSELDDIAQECQDKLSNIPEQLQEADSGQMLQTRSESCESASSDISSADIPSREEVLKEAGLEDNEENADKIEEALDNKAQEIWDEIQDHLGNISD